ncbi:MAG: helix-turn-helix domain-containing protein [Solirubrobacterales bacterium]|nr:helix-turn-helix domain-containing protein [Solirubrobacterales bacterium]
MPPGIEQTSGLAALDLLTTAVEDGAGLPEIVRAAARVLDASLVLIDRGGTVLAVAARSTADERALLRDSEGVEAIDLRVGDAEVGSLRLRQRGKDADVSLRRLVAAVVASEVERVRAPERASEEALGSFLEDALSDSIISAEDGNARASEMGLRLEDGVTLLVVRAHARVASGDDWRPRLLAVAGRAARGSRPGSVAANTAHVGTDGEVLVIVPDPDGESGRAVGDALLRELTAGLPGFGFAIGRSGRADGAAGLARAAKEALLAANVVEGDEDRQSLGFEETGAYRLVLRAMTEDPEELRSFYGETVEPIAAYDTQYESNLVGTLSTFLECDGNVGATAARLITHRHTVRYRLERIKELSGLDVGSSEGREKLSLGLKAMRVLGITPPRGPASEPTAGGR